MPKLILAFETLAIIPRRVRREALRVFQIWIWGGWLSNKDAPADCRKMRMTSGPFCKMRRKHA